VHEELIKQKTAFQSRLQDRDSEINRLRNQVSTSYWSLYCCPVYRQKWISNNQYAHKSAVGTGLVWLSRKVHRNGLKVLHIVMNDAKCIKDCMTAEVDGTRKSWQDHVKQDMKS